MLTLLATLLLPTACVDEPEDGDLAEEDDIDFRPAPVRICAGCTYKTSTFSSVPTSSIETATLKVVVTHVGDCPQQDYPDNCKETLSYNVKCKLGASSNITLPILIDAAPSNNNRTATLAVKVVGQSMQYFAGTLQTGSGTSTLPATPCPPPTVNPYVTFPQVL